MKHETHTQFTLLKVSRGMLRHDVTPWRDLIGRNCWLGTNDKLLFVPVCCIFLGVFLLEMQLLYLNEENARQTTDWLSGENVEYHFNGSSDM